MAQGKRTIMMGWVVVLEWDEDEPARLGLETEDGEEIELELDEEGWEIGHHLDAFVEVEGLLSEDDDGLLSMLVKRFEPIEEDADDDLDEDDED